MPSLEISRRSPATELTVVSAENAVAVSNGTGHRRRGMALGLAETGMERGEDGVRMLDNFGFCDWKRMAAEVGVKKRIAAAAILRRGVLNG